MRGRGWGLETCRRQALTRLDSSRARALIASLLGCFLTANPRKKYIIKCSDEFRKHTESSEISTGFLHTYIGILMYAFVIVIICADAVVSCVDHAL